MRLKELAELDKLQQRRATFDFIRDAMDEEELVVTVLGGASDDDAAALKGLTMWASVNNLSWSPS